MLSYNEYDSVVITVANANNISAFFIPPENSMASNLVISESQLVKQEQSDTEFILDKKGQTGYVIVINSHATDLKSFEV